MASYLQKVLQFPTRHRIGNFCRQLTCESTSNFPVNTPVFPHLALVENNWIYQRNEKIRLPINQKHYIELPKNIIYPTAVEDPLQIDKVIEDPIKNEDNRIEAARLIVIRRQKMKNHKLRKLRKRLKFERAKIRQKRELKKEKEFQAVLVQQCKDAEGFSAEEYVLNRLEAYKKAQEYVPKKYKTFYG